MTIKVITNINEENYKDIKLFWDINKVQGIGNLELLNSKNGGFQTFHLYEKQGIKYENIHQLHWYSNYLVSYTNYPGFSNEEEYLLYKSLCFALGKENVLFYKSFSDAYMSSPTKKYLQNVNISPPTPNLFLCYKYRTGVKI